MRYGRVSTAMSGIALRMAGQHLLGIQADRQKQAQSLRDALGGLKGPLMKVAQLLATIPDILPQEYVTELSQLQANAPAMGWPFVKRRMTAELGPNWQTQFKQFDHTAIAAASLGQVHKAIDHDGQLLACKLQYPDMSTVVEADLRQLSLIFSLFERYDQSVKTDQIHAEIAARLHEELDYQREARHLTLYREIHTTTPGVHIPEVIWNLSTNRLLTMTWSQGDNLIDHVQHHPASGNILAMNMFRAWYVPFYYYGIIHGDPHLGNYTMQPDCSINLFDFGCIRIFKPQFVKAVIDLYHALLNDDQELAVSAYRMWGFDNLSKELIDILNIWARFIYAPLMDDRVRKMEETNSTTYGRQAAQHVHKALHEVGGIEIPRAFVFMDRAAIGLGSVFLRLKAQINWYQLFHELIRDFDVDDLARRQRTLLQRHKLLDAQDD